MLTSQNPRILIKFKDFLDGDPPLLMEFNCFVLYRTFYRLYQQEDGRQDVSREIFPGCRQELFQYYFWQYGTAPRGKSGQHGLLFPRPARCCPYAYVYPCFHIFLNRLHFDQLTLRCSHSTLKSQINLALAGRLVTTIYRRERVSTISNPTSFPYILDAVVQHLIQKRPFFFAV